MKSTITLFALALLSGATAYSQDRTTVNAVSYDISDNLDLRAVASIFGEANDLEDFERRLNDPKVQISNLDLNRDNQVDYLRVIESVEKNTHLIIIQAILDRDTFQDVATIEVERDRNNNVQVQVVGDVYMYGNNYIYEPVYVQTPVFYNHFWTPIYRPYYSSWYWGYYPSYYYAWNPYPTYYYHNHVHNHINIHNHYNYVNVRRSARAERLYSSRRSNGFERQHPERSFAQRNAGVTNRQALTSARTRTNSDHTLVTSARATPQASVSDRSATSNRNATRTTTSSSQRTPVATPRSNTTSSRSTTRQTPTTTSSRTEPATSPSSTRSTTYASNYRSEASSPNISSTRSQSQTNYTAPRNTSSTSRSTTSSSHRSSAPAANSSTSGRGSSRR